MNARTKEITTMRYSIYPGPVGPLLLVADEEHRLVTLHFAHDGAPVGPDWVEDDDALRVVRAQLDEYFAGTRMQFDLELAPTGTPFQLEVWEQLRRIPYGETISYGELADRVHRPGAARAVGSANGQNPIAIIVPCHRVIGADGSLTGFGGGLEWKQWLLTREQPQGSLIDG